MSRWIARHWRYGRRDDLRADSLREAITFQMYGNEDGTHAPDEILYTGAFDSAVVLDKTALSDLWVGHSNWYDARVILRLYRETKARRPVLDVLSPPTPEHP